VDSEGDWAISLKLEGMNTSTHRRLGTSQQPPENHQDRPARVADCPRKPAAQENWLEVNGVVARTASERTCRSQVQRLFDSGHRRSQAAWATESR
jgi:hypothetical protein